MKFIADFHLHSKYSMATSKDSNLETLEHWARLKGIDVIGTADFTHPAWRKELTNHLIPDGNGLYTLNENLIYPNSPQSIATKAKFIVSGEICTIFKHNGKTKKIHQLIILPSIEAAEKISTLLERTSNLELDGRPILNLESRTLLDMVLSCCSEAIFIPAHVWSPHFSLFGAFSGFDEIEDCYGDLTSYIYAIETGLSSDPPMNWKVSKLDKFSLISNSDAHSPANLGRESTIFETAPSYNNILEALKHLDTNELYGTIEFFPQEGKYHLDGHRKCLVCLAPEDTRALKGKCPVCGRKITIGVLHRIEDLADREESATHKRQKHYERLIPLAEVIASSIGFTAKSMKVRRTYENLIENLGTEFFILRNASINDIRSVAGDALAQSIDMLRKGNVQISPGFDGQYGKVSILQ